MFQLTHVTYKDILNIHELHIPAHKITCIVGQSGSGKTTLLRLLNNLIRPNHGEIQYDGRSLHAIDAIMLRRQVVMLGQTPAIFPGSLRDNLLIGLKFSEKALVKDDQLLEVLNRVHLNKPLDTDADNLSGGEKQRVALGRVMLMDPKVLLLDEPSSALDEATEEKIIADLIAYVKASSKTLIMVTHSKKIAETYGDNIIEINNGQLKID